MGRFHVYSVANDSKVLASDLQSSPDIVSRAVPLTVLWHESSASEAYARAIAAADAEILIFAHQDIYLPRHWFDRLEKSIQHLDKLDEK